MSHLHRCLILFGVVVCFLSDAFSSPKEGSANQFLGRTYVLSCFISMPDNPWTTQEKEQVYAKIQEAEQWFVREGKKYGVDMHFEHGFFGWEKDISFSNLSKHYTI